MQAESQHNIIGTVDMSQATMMETRERAAQDYEQAAAELERAAQHFWLTAQHFRDADVPRACAHTFAAIGHLSTVERQIKALAELHATKAQV
jgi:uncharacterized protein YbaP (TraB family)